MTKDQALGLYENLRNSTDGFAFLNGAIGFRQFPNLDFSYGNPPKGLIFPKCKAQKLISFLREWANLLEECIDE